MGKRSKFPRHDKDHYDTPEEAVLPLLPHLSSFTMYYEPCAGTGELINHLECHSIYCVAYSDDEIDARVAQYNQKEMSHISDDFEYFITNPPWDRKILHPIIENLMQQKPTWLLFDADWMHTKQSKDLIKYCQKIVSVGRVKWIPDSKHTGKDNCCWYLFDKIDTIPIFYGRT